VTGSAQEIAAALVARQSFLLTSHARPDGDAIGSSMALGLALADLGKTVTVALRDPVPSIYQAFPGIDRIQITDRAPGPADAAVLLECSDPSRPEMAGLEGYPLINIDHHLGNTMYGVVNWFDEGAAACGELVADLIDALGVPWTREIAAHLYLALSTDTGGFRYGPISAHTFDICRRIADAGVSTPDLSRQIFDSFSVGRVRLMGALLNAMELFHKGRFAVLYLDDDLLRRSGASTDDVEGLVNIPLGAREICAVALIKRQPDGTCRVSLRSKGLVDVRSVASQWAGGGHRNAAGCTIRLPADEVKAALVRAVEDVVGICV
jgi:phosphoesterase RecJ-like protein